jgi:hypothetical protein
MSLFAKRVIPLAVISVCLTGCGSSTTSPTITSTGILTINSDSGVSSTDQNLVRDEVLNAALPYFASVFGWQPTQPIVVDLTTSLPSGAVEFAIGLTSGNTITIDVDSAGWCCSAYGDVSKRRTIVHELFHMLQYSIGWLPGNPRSYWLVEGSAEYASFQATVILTGLGTADGVRTCERNRVVTSSPPLPALSLLEGQSFYSLVQQGVLTYPDGYLAADRIVAGSGLPSLMVFGRLASSFPDSFQPAFGEPLSAFYADFAQDQQTWTVSSTGLSCY